MESIVDACVLATDCEADLVVELQWARKQVARVNAAMQGMLYLTACSAGGMVFAGAAIANLGMVSEGVLFCAFGAVVITGCAAFNQGA